MIEKFLFLDFDGVINTHRSLFKKLAEHYNVAYSEKDFSEQYWNEIDGLNPELLNRINKERDSGNFDEFSLDMYNFPFDDICIKYCNQIINENNTNICVCSSWRLNRSIEKLQEILDGVGIIGKVIGKTGNSADRGLEIYEWVKNYQKTHNIITNICIIDDEHAYGIDYIFSDYTVKDINSIRHGLRKHHIKEAQNIFNLPFSFEKIK